MPVPEPALPPAPAAASPALWLLALASEAAVADEATSAAVEVEVEAEVEAAVEVEAAAAEVEAAAVGNAKGAAALEVCAVSCRHGRAGREPLLSACDMLLSDMSLLTWYRQSTRAVCARVCARVCAYGVCMGHGWCACCLTADMLLTKSAAREAGGASRSRPEKSTCATREEASAWCSARTEPMPSVSSPSPRDAASVEHSWAERRTSPPRSLTVQPKLPPPGSSTLASSSATPKRSWSCRPSSRLGGAAGGASADAGPPAPVPPPLLRPAEMPPPPLFPLRVVARQRARCRASESASRSSLA